MMKTKKWMTPILALSIGLAAAPAYAGAQDIDQGATTDTSTAKEVEVNQTKIDATVVQGTQDDKPALEATIDYDGLVAGEKYFAVLTVSNDKGEVVADGEKVEFTAADKKGTQKVVVGLKEAIANGSVSISIVDAEGKTVGAVPGEIKIGTKDAQPDKPGEDKPGEDKDKPGKDREGNKRKERGATPQIKTNASMDADVIQTGAVVSDTIRYEGLVPGTEYRVETRLMCQENAEDTGASKTTNFVADKERGDITIEGIEIKDADCMKQVVFEKIFEAETGRLVAVHEDLDDAAQTVGDGHTSKKKKKKNPTTKITRTVPKAPALGDGSPGRSTIGSVPSGGFDTAGATLFTR